MIIRKLCLGLLGFLLISCNESQPKEGVDASNIHQIDIDVNQAIPVHGFDLIHPTFYHRLDTAYLLNFSSTRRILRDYNQIAFLQNAPGTSDFVIFDSLGQLKSSIDGLHGGPNNFAHACDVAAINDKSRYDILVRNPTRMVSVSLNGENIEESMLPFSEAYMDLYYTNNKYLFFADNGLSLGKPNLRSTDDEFKLINYFDPVDPIQMQPSTINRDKLHFNHENDQYLHQPSLIYDSIYILSSDGNYQPFAYIDKTNSFSESELRRIEQSDKPFDEYKKLFRKYKNNFPVMSLYIYDDILIIPYGNSYMVFYDIINQKTITFELLSDELKLFPLREAKGQFFIIRTAYQITEHAPAIHELYDKYPDKVRQYMAYAKDVNASDNPAIIDFDWNIEFIRSHFD